MAVIQPRRGTAASATSNNPVLASGETGLETDTGRTKKGDGSTPWNALPYDHPLLSLNGSDFPSQGAVRHNLLVPVLTPAACLADANVAALTGLGTFDGYTLVDGDQILLTAQTTASQNGPWTAHSGAWTRPTGFPAGAVNTKGARTIAIISGAVYAKQTWLLQTNGSITIDTTAQTWVPAGGGGSSSAATGAALGTVKVSGGITDPANPIARSADDFQIKALAADQALALSSTVLQDITALPLAITNSPTEVWLVKYWVRYQAANTAMDIKPGFTVPAGATVSWQTIGNMLGVGVGAAPLAMLGAGGSQPLGGAALVASVLIVAWVFGGGTAGNAQFRAAQNTADAGTLTILKGTTMEAVRVAA